MSSPRNCPAKDHFWTHPQDLFWGVSFGWLDYREVAIVSSLKKQGIDHLQEQLFSQGD